MGVAEKDHTIAAAVQAIGILTMIGGLVWGAIVLFNQMARNKTPDPAV